jgi:hypothetical protein
MRIVLDITKPKFYYRLAIDFFPLRIHIRVLVEDEGNPGQIQDH